WDGVADTPRRGWVVVVRGERIAAVGPEATTAVPSGAARIALAGATLMPGLIEGHSHLFLHPYDETLWDDQVLREPLGLRAARAMTPEGMRRATLAGVETIEHGDEGTPEVFRLMRQRGVALCPTLAAGEAYATYFEHWVKGRDAPIPALVTKRNSFRAALDA